MFSAIRLTGDDLDLCGDVALTADTVKVALGEDFVISAGGRHTFGLVADLSPSVEPGNYVFCLEDSTFMDLADRNLLSVVYPYLVTGEFPVISSDISVVGSDLSGSFTNWPNPFNPGRDDHTTLGFVLSEEADVDIELYTMTGDLVCTIVSNDRRPAGSYSQDVWEGLNDGGSLVQPGTYFCCIRARYVSGRRDDLKRKVAVIR